MVAKNSSPKLRAVPTDTNTSFYIPQQKTRWVEWIDENDDDGTPFRARVRANLSFGEANELTFQTETPMTEVHAKLAPLVLAWNVGRINEDGEPEAVPAPADGDPTVFEHVPNAFFWWLFSEIKINGSSRLDPKASAPSASTPGSESA